MRIRVEQFCALATSPSWQAWLFAYSEELYKKFIAKLQKSRGCSDNSKIMIDVLESVNQDKLFAFLLKNYPHIIDGYKPPLLAADDKNDKVFEYYNPNILTYPRRIVFTGDKRTLKKMINEFVLDKIKYDSIIVGNTGYVEFLTAEDKHLVKMIPNSNWQIPAYRMRKTNG